MPEFKTILKEFLDKTKTAEMMEKYDVFWGHEVPSCIVDIILPNGSRDSVHSSWIHALNFVRQNKYGVNQSQFLRDFAHEPNSGASMRLALAYLYKFHDKDYLLLNGKMKQEGASSQSIQAIVTEFNSVCRAYDIYPDITDRIIFTANTQTLEKSFVVKIEPKDSHPDSLKAYYPYVSYLIK